jgi:protein-disulfide isomerase
MTIGPDTAPVTILDFGDFECPFCARFYSVAKQIRSRYGVNIRLRFRNLPIPALHPHALAAARAAECSSHFGAFEPFHNYLFEHHDSLGVESWSAIARKAGIADTLAFEKCLDAPTTMAALTNDSLDAERLRVTGTPTILINNWRMQASPTFSAVDSLVVEVLKKSRSR